MENKRDSEIDGCYTGKAFLFPSLHPSLRLPTHKHHFFSVLSCKQEYLDLSLKKIYFYLSFYFFCPFFIKGGKK
jgi:hypothetical protein